MKRNELIGQILPVVANLNRGMKDVSLALADESDDLVAIARLGLLPLLQLYDYCLFFLSTDRPVIMKSRRLEDPGS